MASSSWWDFLESSLKRGLRIGPLFLKSKEKIYKEPCKNNTSNIYSLNNLKLHRSPRDFHDPLKLKG